MGYGRWLGQLGRAPGIRTYGLAVYAVYGVYGVYSTSNSTWDMDAGWASWAEHLGYGHTAWLYMLYTVYTVYIPHQTAHGIWTLAGPAGPSTWDTDIRPGCICCIRCIRCIFHIKQHMGYGRWLGQLGRAPGIR